MKTIDKMGRFANSVDVDETTRESSHKHLYFFLVNDYNDQNGNIHFKAETVSQNV